MELNCVHAFVGQQAVLQVSGEIDLATVPLFRDHLVRLVDTHPGATVIVDLDGVTALDDTGLGMLLGAAGRARQLEGDLVLVCSGERLLARFALTGLDRAVTVQPTI
ncbi:MAG: STAS domain-containing protein [Actinobacteria bacterium]|nr:STAS domain-containing protein [Actinomycetota bacterium]